MPGNAATGDGAVYPFFFGPAPGDRRKFHEVDAMPMMECLRRLTAVLSQSTELEQADRDPDRVWIDGAASKLLFSVVDSHRQSVHGVESEVAEASKTRWCSIAIASGLYMHSVLGIWNAGELMDKRLFQHVMSIFTRDLDESFRADFGDVLFWMVFVGAYSLALHYHEGEP